MGKSASDVRAGGAFYELSAKDGVSAALDRVKAKWLGFGQVFAAVNPMRAGGGLFSRVDGFVGGLASGLRQIGRDAAAAAKGLAKVGAGVSVAGGVLAAPLLALFKGGLDRAGDLARLSRQLGLPIQTLNKLQYAADAAGVSLDEVMQDRTGRYSDLVARAPEMDPADARAAAAAQLELSDATRALQDALLPLVQTVAPYVKMLAGWVKENAALLAVAVPVAAALTATGLAAAVAATAVGGLATIAGVAWSALGTLAGAALSPFGLAAAAVAGLGYAFFTMTDTGRAAGAALRRDLVGAMTTARSAFGGLAAAIRKGDLGGALEIATTGVELLWAGLLARLTKAWGEFVEPFEDGWHRVTDGLGPILSDLWADLKGGFAAAAAFVRGGLDAFVNGWRRAVAKVADIWEEIKGPVMAVVDFLKPALAAVALPLIGAVALIREAWDGLDANVAVNLGRLAKTVAVAYARITGEVENAFAAVTQRLLRMLLTALRTLDQLNPTDAFKGAIKSVEGLDAALAKRRDVSAEVELITRGHAEVEKGLLAEREKARAARAAGDAAEAKAADDRIANLQAKLDGLVGAANVPRPAGVEAKLAPIKEGLLGTVGVKGGFGSAALGQQFGYGDQVNKQTELLRQLVDQNGRLPENISRQLAPLVRPQAIR